MPDQEPRARPARRTWAALFALVALALVAGGYWYYRVEARRIRQEKYHEIAAIAELKAGQILQWRKERLADVERVTKSPSFQKATAEFLRAPATPGRRADMLASLRNEEIEEDADDVILLTTGGRILLGTKDDTDPVDPATKLAIETALAGGKAVLSDFYRCPHGIVHVDAAAPMLDADGHPLAVIVLRSDAEHFLYPMIQSWPTPSPSAETLLVRRDGEEVVFLNELRHMAGAALSLREPLTRSELPAVQAVLGKQGMFEGKDYRGVEVLADLRPIPGTPWFMVAKVDTDEILAEARYRAGGITILVIILILLAAVVTALVYRHRRAGLYRALYQEVRELKKQTQFVLGATHTGLDIIDSEFNVRYIDPEWQKVYGDRAGRKCYEYFMGRDQMCPDCGVMKALETKEATVTEKILVKENNRPVQVTTMPFQDERGEWLVAEVNVDITERKRAEEGLRVALVKYKTLFKSFPLGITVADPAGKILETNLMAEKLLGVSPEEHDRREIDGSEWRIVRPDGTPMPAEEYASVRALREGRRVEGVEMGIVKPGSEITWISVTAAPLPLEGYGVVITYGDITERKRAEEALRFTRLSLDNAADTMVCVGRDGRLLDVNDAFCRSVGHSREELLSMTVHDIDPNYSAEVWPEFWKKLKQSGSLTFESCHRTKAGKLVPVEVTVTFFEHNGKEYHCGFAHDITERKQAEEAREKLDAQLRQSQKMETVGRLAGGVAHDFNNVLTGIMGYAEFVRGYLGENAAARKDIAQILSLTQRAAGITQQLLAFARRQTLQLAVCNINISLRNVGELLSPLIGEDIDLKFFPAPDLGNVHADAGQIGQVLVNMAVNARDAMPDGGKLTIETANASLDQTYADTHPEVKPGEYVMIAVTDTGCGMDEATRARLFEPFFTTKEEGKGTGLGLATAYGIVKQHGGHIHVYSEPGKGTCFKIYLPRVCDAVKQATSPAEAPIAERGEGVVLVVDDEASICNIIARILTENGYEVVAAASPGEAQKRFAAHQQEIRLLLTDVVLPGANGRELYEQCVKLKPSLRVLYMSGYTDNAIAHRGVLDAGTSFIGKPFTSAELLRKVRQVLAS